MCRIRVVYWRELPPLRGIPRGGHREEASTTRASSIVIRQTEEWAHVESALLHEPGREALFGLMEVDAEDIEAPLDLTAAQWDHQNYRFLLEARGIEVVSFRDALTAGAIDPVGEPLEGPALDRLRRAANEALLYSFSPGVPESRRRALLSRRERIINRAHPEVLVDLLFLKPLVRVGFGGDPELMEHCIRPARSAHFVRDALVVTAAGAVLGRASSPARRWENELMSLALEGLGTAPLARIESPGFFEGGDFIPVGDFALMRIGPMTNEVAFEQMLRARAFGVPEIGLIRDADSPVTHLDDYLVFVAPDLAIVHEDRFGSDGEPPVEVYCKGEANPTRTVGLFTYLREKGMEIVPALPETPYTLSGLMVVGPREVVIAAGVGNATTQMLMDRGVEVQVLALESAGGRGGLRGLTQVLRRGI